MSEAFVEYEINAVADFDAIPDDKLEACLADFLEFNRIKRLLAGMFDRSVAYPMDRFTWRDDGEAGLSEIRIHPFDSPPDSETDPDEETT